jgi:hypothetical protein
MEPPEANFSSQRIASRRPGSVTVLVLGVLILTAVNLVRFILSLRDWSFLNSLPGVSPYYLAITGFIWAVAGAALIWSLWTARSWVPRLMQAEALTYALYYWLDLLFLKDHPLSVADGALRAILPGNWLISAGVTVVCLAYIVWALGRSRVKAYFNPAIPTAIHRQANQGPANEGPEDES